MVFFCSTNINVVIGIDLSSHVPTPGQHLTFFTEAIQAAKSAITCSEYTIAVQAVTKILQEYDR